MKQLNIDVELLKKVLVGINPSKTDESVVGLINLAAAKGKALETLMGGMEVAQEEAMKELKSITHWFNGVLAGIALMFAMADDDARKALQDVAGKVKKPLPEVKEGACPCGEDHSLVNNEFKKFSKELL